MHGKTCFFIGSRHSSSNIRGLLIEAIEKHIIEYGVTTFIVGHYGNFDSMVTAILKKTKKKYPNIELYLLCPYALNQEKEAPEGFDGTLYPDGLEFVPKLYAIVQANRYMIEHSDYLIANPGIGNSRKIVEFAQKQQEKGLIKVTLITIKI